MGLWGVYAMLVLRVNAPSTFSFTIAATTCRTVTCPVQQFVSTAVSNVARTCGNGRVNGATVQIGQTSAWAASTACATLNTEIVQTVECNLQGRYMFIVLPVVTGSEILNFYELNGICSECAAGKYSLVVALNAESGCIDCPTNHASGNGFSSCALCDRGKYWVAETSVCTVCAVPKYKTQLGLAACLSCVGDSVFIAADQACTQLTEGCVTGYYYEGLNCVRCPITTRHQQVQQFITETLVCV